MSGGTFGRGKAPERACMKLADWPAEDRRRWMLALEAGDIFDEEKGARAGHSPASNRKAEVGYGRFLTYLSMNAPADLALTPEARITPARVKAYVVHLRSTGNASQTILARLQELGEVAKVMDPDRDWFMIRDCAARVRAGHKPVRDKRDIRLSDELLSLGLDLMERAGHAQGLEAALLFRDGLIIAFLANIPVRRRNLADLVIGKNLVRTEEGWLVIYGETETKTHAVHEVWLPEVLNRPLETYLDRHRPLLVERTGRWTSDADGGLWISKDGSRMTEMAIYDRVRAHTKAAFGKPMGLHAFRYAAATTLAIDDPGHVRIAAPVLGHRTFGTTERYYQQATGMEAHRIFTKTLKTRLEQQ